MQWMHFKTLSAFFKYPLSRLVKMMHLLHPPQMSRLWINSIITDLSTDFLFSSQPLWCLLVSLIYVVSKESWGKFFITAFGRALPPPYNVGSSVYIHTHTHTRAHTHTHPHPWKRKWQPSPVFLPGEFHGQRSLVGYSPWDYKEPDMTEWLTHTYVCMYI